ncbi:MAG: tail fiber protein [Bacteroidia bacterium]|nr:tail fiber protein [Bacteroidia bacterium]
MKKTTLLFCALWFALSSNAQQKAVSINETGAAPNNASILDVSSTTKGVLFPRMSSVQRDAIVNPPEGLEIYNISRKCKEIFTGTRWTSSVPAGSIQPFVGDTAQIPEGWLLCDGGEVSRTLYADLFISIGISWGAGDMVNTFHLPDLRGYFPRGVDGTAGNDPDVATRTAINVGGNTGNNVGSLQADVIANHSHAGLYSPATSGGSNNTTCINSTYSSNASNSMLYLSGETGSVHLTVPQSSETRPKNVYVNYIIKSQALR